MTPQGKTIAALGGPQTFGDQACRQLMASYPEFDNIAYFETAEALFDAVANGSVAAAMAPEQMARSGFHLRQQAYLSDPNSPLYVAAEVAHEYHCCLLGRPGATLEGVLKVIGHTGSMTQSRQWIEQNLPHAEIEIVHTNSRTAAQTVFDGDGSIACVATPAMATELGMLYLARDIDGGSVGNYWAFTGTPWFSPRPLRLVVTGRFGDDPRRQGTLSALLSALSEAGYALQTICSQSTGRQLFEFDYVLRLRGAGRLEDVEAIIAAHPHARLAGAFEPR